MLELQMLIDEQKKSGKVMPRKVARTELTVHSCAKTKPLLLQQRVWEPWLIRSGVSVLANEGVSHIGIYTDFI